MGYEIDWTKVTTLEDLKTIIATLTPMTFDRYDMRFDILKPYLKAVL